VPLFQVANAVVDALGTACTMVTCMLAASGRFFGWWAARSVWQLLPFEAFHGYVFAMYFTVAAKLAEEHAPLGLHATVIGASSAFQQAGQMAATVGWSAVVDACGMRASFAAAAVGFALAGLLLAVGPSRERCRRGGRAGRHAPLPLSEAATSTRGPAGTELDTEAAGISRRETETLPAAAA
jgi:hypothetical protein